MFFFYDKQMCIYGGVGNSGNGSDVVNRAVGRMTINMVGNNLQNPLGANWNFWTFSSGYHYPSLKNAGNILYVNGTNGRNDYSANNEHLYHISCAVLKLQDGGSPIETTSNMRTNMFITTFHPNGPGLSWSRTGPPSNRVFIWFTSGNENIWDARNYQGNAVLKAQCGGFFKEIPVFWPVALPKTTEFASLTNGIFDVSEVFPNIVTDNATVEVSTAHEGNLTVAIYDLAGSKVMDISDQFINANTTVKVDLNNLSNLATGSYIVVVSVGNDVAIRKFIKQ